MQVKRNSWHYRLNLHMTSSSRWAAEKLVHNSNSFCDYWRLTAWNMLKVMFIAFFGLLALGLFLVAGYKIVSTFDAIKTMMLLFGGGVGFLIAWGIISLAERAERRRDRILFGISDPEPEQTPGLVGTWYASWKQKFCPPVTFEGDQQ